MMNQSNKISKEFYDFTFERSTLSLHLRETRSPSPTHPQPPLPRRPALPLQAPVKTQPFNTHTAPAPQFCVTARDSEIIQNDNRFSPITPGSVVNRYSFVTVLYGVPRGVVMITGRLPTSL